jgi:hypothetical protein
MITIHKPENRKKMNLSDEIAFLSSELRTCENLVAMGYISCWGKKIEGTMKEIKSRVYMLQRSRRGKK